jgi:hypothetical protein
MFYGKNLKKHKRLWKIHLNLKKFFNIYFLQMRLGSGIKADTLNARVENKLPIISISVSTPIKGAIVYNQATDSIYYSDGTLWLPIAGGGGGGILAGDVTGPLLTNTVSFLQTVPLVTAGLLTPGYSLIYDGVNWAPRQPQLIANVTGGNTTVTAFLDRVEMEIGGTRSFLVSVGTTNTLVGYGSGSGIVGGTQNTIVGYTANVGAATTRTVVVGNNTTSLANDNVVIGTDAYTTAEGSVMIGSQAGRPGAGNQQVIGIGWQSAGFASVGVCANFATVAIGVSAFTSALQAIDSVAIGNEAALNVTRCTNCIMIGVNSCTQPAAGLGFREDVTCVGANSGQSTTEDQLTFIGSGAGSAGFGTTEAAGVGYAVLQFIRGASNTAVGHTSMQGGGPATAARNAAFGTRTLINIDSGTDNVAVGYESGILLITGTSNTLVGASTTTNLGTISSATVVGANSSGSTNSAILGQAATDNGFSGCIVLGQGGSASANDQLVLGGTKGVTPTATFAAQGFVAGTGYITAVVNGVDVRIPIFLP